MTGPGRRAAVVPLCHAHAALAGAGAGGQATEVSCGGAKRYSGRDLAVLASLSTMMFLSPCLEMELYYVVAAGLGWTGIAVVSIIYMTITVSTMIALVAAAAKGLERVRWTFLEHREGQLSGGLLILLGLAWLAFPL